MSDETAVGAAETIDTYYAALRAGDPLGPFFAAEDGVVKFGISERLDGNEEIVAGLAEQTATTSDWRVESHDRTVTERDGHAWYHDAVTLSWTDETGERLRFETRWSGTLERTDGAWEFVVLHVSTPGEL